MEWGEEFHLLQKGAIVVDRLLYIGEQSHPQHPSAAPAAATNAARQQQGRQTEQ